MRWHLVVGSLLISRLIWIDHRSLLRLLLVHPLLIKTLICVRIIILLLQMLILKILIFIILKALLFLEFLRWTWIIWLRWSIVAAGDTTTRAILRAESHWFSSSLLLYVIFGRAILSIVAYVQIVVRLINNIIGRRSRDCLTISEYLVLLNKLIKLVVFYLIHLWRFAQIWRDLGHFV